MLFLNADLDKWDLKPIQMTISAAFTQVNGSPQYLGGWAYKVLQRVSICFNHFMTPALSRSCYLHRATKATNHKPSASTTAVSASCKKLKFPSKRNRIRDVYGFSIHIEDPCGASRPSRSQPALPLYHAAELTSILDPVGGNFPKVFSAFPEGFSIVFLEMWV